MDVLGMMGVVLSVVALILAIYVFLRVMGWEE